jgi:anti-sigma factor RsiW
MRHEEEGTLLAYLDGELVGDTAGGVEAHLTACDACRESAERLRGERTQVRAALESVPVDAGAAALRVRERLRARHPELAAPVATPRVAPRVTPARSTPPRRQPAGTPVRWRLRTRLLQAAVLVLFVSGGAAALVPGSPLRRWLEGGAVASPESAPLRIDAPAPLATQSAQVSLGATAVGGRLRVAVELPAGTDLRVVFVDGERATVTADAATRFRSAEGVLEAEVPGGPVRVELPRGAEDVSLTVGGELYVRVRNGEVQSTVPAADSSDAEISFRIR